MYAQTSGRWRDRSAASAAGQERYTDASQDSLCADSGKDRSLHKPYPASMGKRGSAAVSGISGPQGEGRVWRGWGGGAADSETCREAPRGERAQVHKLSAVGAPHPLVLESPQSTLKALLIVSRY